MTSQLDVERSSFWRAGRRRYNLALLASGLLAGLAFAAVILAWNVWPPPPESFGHADFELLSLVLAPVAYGFAMLVANACYSLGPLVERLLRPSNADGFRRRAYRMGLAFSVELPWLVPLNAWREFIVVKVAS